jgi:acyl carrier protein
MEKRVMAIVAPLLGLEQVGVEDNFFLVGGHSLLVTQIIARLREAFHVELSLRSLFDAPTVARLSAEVERLLVEKLDAMTEADARRLFAAGEVA